MLLNLPDPPWQVTSMDFDTAGGYDLRDFGDPSPDVSEERRF